MIGINRVSMNLSSLQKKKGKDVFKCRKEIGLE